MQRYDNCILSSYYPYLSSCVINGAAGKSDESSEIMLSLCACSFEFTCSRYLGAIQIISVLTSRTYYLIHEQIFSYHRVAVFYSHFPRVSTGTLSVCVNERFAQPLLHTVALQFLCTVFTEETKSRSQEVTTSNSKYVRSLSDVLNSPSASELCELLLQVWWVDGL